MELFRILSQASIVGLVSMFMGIVPLGTSVVYALWPSEQRLALMRPLSLATIFAAISGSTLGILNVLRDIGVRRAAELSPAAAIGLAEALVPVFLGSGCLTVAWLLVALGLWRRP